MPDRAINIMSPLAGVHKAYTLQAQPPYTTPSANNARPTGEREGRRQVGRRPCLRKALDGAALGGPIRLLTSVEVAEDDGVVGQSFLSESFDRMFADDGKPGGWIFQIIAEDDETFQALGDYDMPLIHNGTALASQNFGGLSPRGAALRLTSDDIDTAEPITLTVTTLRGFFGYESSFDLWFGLDPAAPDEDDGIRVRLEVNLSGSNYTRTVTVEHYTLTGSSFSATLATVPASTGSMAFSATKTGTSMTVSVDGALVDFGSGTTITVAAGDAGVGISLKPDGISREAIIDSFECRYYAPAGEYTAQSGTQIIVGANGELHRVEGRSLVQISGPAIVSTDPLSSVEYQGKLIIADRGDVIASGNDGQITSNVLTNTGATDFAAAGATATDHVVEITAPAGAAVVGTFRIASISTTSITLDTGTANPGEYNGGDGACTFRVVVPPKVYDPATDTLDVFLPAHSPSASLGTGGTKGVMPIGYPIVCRYSDRLVFAGGRQWIMSRQGNNLDWDTGVSDVDPGRALSAVSTEASRTPAPIVDVMEHGDDYLIFAMERELWMLRGDPGFGGRLDRVTGSSGGRSSGGGLGLAARGAWCDLPGGAKLFLSKANGVHMIGADGRAIQPVSRASLPTALLNLSAANTIAVAYNPTYEGVEIHVDSAGYFLDLGESGSPASGTGGGFWNMNFASAIKPTTVYSAGQFLVGCEDGFVREYAPELANDDGNTVACHVVLGPFRVGRSDFEWGRVMSLDATLGEASDDVLWKLYAHHTAAGAVAAASNTIPSGEEDGTWTASNDDEIGGLNTTNRVMKRGTYFAIRLEGSGVWAFESAIAILRADGKRRR